MKLVTEEEFRKHLNFNADDIKTYWNKDLYKCPRCGAGVKRDYSVVYMSNPPKYRYFCRECGYENRF